MLKKVPSRVASKASIALLAAGLILTVSACGSSGGNAGTSASGAPSAATPSASASASASAIASAIASATRAPAVPASPSPSASASESPQTNPYAVAGVTDLGAFKQIFEVLKAAVAKDDKEQAAACSLFPVRVNNGKKSLQIKTKAEFVKLYDQIFTVDVKKALAAQDADKMFANWKGVMAGNGEIWFGATAETPQQYGIISVNPGGAAAK